MPGGNWEYKIVRLVWNGLVWVWPENEADFNALGEQGWELVNVDVPTGTAFFKRGGQQ